MILVLALLLLLSLAQTSSFSYASSNLNRLYYELKNTHKNKTNETDQKGLMHTKA